MKYLKISVIFLVLFLSCLLLANSGAQAMIGESRRPDHDKPQPFDKKIHPRESQTDRRLMKPEMRSGQESVTAPASSGGPDEYGYAWDDTVPLNWIDASGGVDTGIPANVFSGAVDIGFPFKFYENTYSQLYISMYGYISFNDEDLAGSPWSIPDPYNPTDLIAPFWTYAAGANYVRYLNGGVSPDRWLVVEWNRLDSDGNEFTFEAILHEDGDIIFQYQIFTLADWGTWCTVSGIENSSGLDGLEITEICQWIEENHAVHIYRPAPAVHIGISPLVQGQFSQPDVEQPFVINVRNTGELGTDTFDVDLVSTWPVSLFTADGLTPLIDTDSDGKVDTGPIAQDNTHQVIASIQAPTPGMTGSNSTTTLVFTSSLDNSKSKTASLMAAFPAPFVQAFLTEGSDTINLAINQVNAQDVKKITCINDCSYPPSVAASKGGNFFTTWSEDYENALGFPVEDILFSLANPFGETLRQPTHLTENQSATSKTLESYPVAAAAPDGTFGVLWSHTVYKNENDFVTYQENMYFSILDEAGEPILGPVSLTGDSTWYSYDEDHPLYRWYSPAISATADNHFTLAWIKETTIIDCSYYDCRFDDIYYTIVDTGGNQIKPITQLTNDTLGEFIEIYWAVNFSPLQNNRVMMTWTRASDGDIYYSVLDSNGEVVKETTNLSNNLDDEYLADTTEFSDGNILAAWTASKGDKRFTRFQILSSSYLPLSAQIDLNNPDSVDTTEETGISVAADQEGRAVITTTNPSNPNRKLYYALVDSAGSVLTQPMIYYTAPTADDFVYINYNGFSTSTYRYPVETGIDTLILTSNQLVGAGPGETVAIQVHLANHGQTTALNPQLTLTFPAELEYLGDSSGLAPSIAPGTVTWNLPEMRFLDEIQFNVHLKLPDLASIGMLYPFTFSLDTKDEVFPADNIYSGEVMASYQFYAPMMLAYNSIQEKNWPYLITK